MKSPVFILPDAMKALYALNKAIEIDRVPPKTHKLVPLRDSGRSLARDAVPHRSRAGGAGAHRVADAAQRPRRPVPDDVWEEATRHYDENALAALILSISQIRIRNRVNCAVRQIAGSWKKPA